MVTKKRTNNRNTGRSTQNDNRHEGFVEWIGEFFTTEPKRNKSTSGAAKSRRSTKAKSAKKR